MKSIPSSVYHLQINENFPLKEVIKILPYLDALGVDGIYCSPLLEAASLHGYDIVNPNSFNQRIGGREAFDLLSKELQERRMKLVFDLVPNHMGIKGKKNLWWLDVLEKGPQSSYADFFDIDWNPLKRELKNKVLLPILGNPYGQSLLNQEIQLFWESGGLWIRYDGYQLPLNPESYDFVLSNIIETETTWLAFLDISQEVQKDNINSKKRLQSLYESSEKVRTSIGQLLSLFNGTKGDYKSFDLLHALLELQHYRLAYWLVAGQEINYRRFFNINELVAIHIENEKVLNEHHRLIFELVREGKVQGLRIDHPDGLYDPACYFEKIQEHKPAFVVIEKILDLNESLPSTWNVQGTVGYEFLNVLNGLFIQKTYETHFSKIYDQFIGHPTDFDFLVYDRKKWFTSIHMGGEINTLGWKLDQFTDSSRYYRDFTRVDLTNALQEVIACFPVYRTYVQPGEATTSGDKNHIIQAVEAAKHKNPQIPSSIYTFIHDLLLSELKEPSLKETDFVLRFQQQTAPVMAKALEDSCFYIFNRFVSLNEVGGNPRYFGTPKSEFHQFNIKKLSKWPLGFLPTSTQDTKWSEDARMRLNVISEIPKEWKLHITAWEKENRKHKKKIHGSLFPDLNTEYYLYQMLLSVWPDDPQQAASTAFHERLWECFLKSMREAGIYTSWSYPNEEHEACAKGFLFSLLSPQEENLFYPSFIEFQKKISYYGRWNSLSSLVLKMGSCGIVDLYQGSEWWNYSLMDPDNRRPVDYPFLENALKHSTESDESLKLWTTAHALNFRRLHKELFLKGEYIPLLAQKERKDNIVTFLRKNEHGCALIAGGRFFTQLPEPPIGKACWGETSLLLPKNLKVNELKNIFTNKVVPLQKKNGKLSLNVADLFQDYPFALLIAN